MTPAVKPMVVHHPPLMTNAPASYVVTDEFAKDAIMGWLRGEFAAANAIIDSLCCHVAEIHGADTSEYKSAFDAIHRRRYNWIPILQMQEYILITDVERELKNVAEMKKMRRAAAAAAAAAAEEENNRAREVDVKETVKNVVVECSPSDDHSVESGEPQSDVTDSGSQEIQTFQDYVNLCSNHEHCEARHDQIKITKGFMAKELVKGHMVNVVRGLKLYEDIFTELELLKLNDFVNELRAAGQNGELSGETFVLYNQQTRGNKRELIQFGVPIFRQITEDNLPKSNIEPIPSLLQSVIEHFVQWRLIPEKKKPNSCIINFFDEGEYSQPFLKPPHLEQPLSTLVLSESTMAFGRTLLADSEGSYRGPLVLHLKEGSLLVMRGNSSDTSRQAMSSSLNKRVTITFFRVRPEREHNNLSEAAPMSSAMTLWNPNRFVPVRAIPEWGLRAPMVTLAPVCQAMVNPQQRSSGGTGVFLPLNSVVGTRKHAKRLPPRAQRGRGVLALTSRNGGQHRDSD